MKDIVLSVVKSSLSLIFMVVTALWGAFITLQSMMDVKVAEAKDHMRIERSAQMNEVKAEVEGVRELVVSIDNKMDILISNQGNKK